MDNKSKTSAELKIVYRQLVKQIHVDDIYDFKLSNIKKIGKKFPSLENAKFTIQYIDDDNKKVLIKSDNDLIKAFVVASSRTFLRVMLVPVESTSSDDDNEDGSDFELVDHSEEEEEEQEQSNDEAESDDESRIFVSSNSVISSSNENCSEPKSVENLAVVDDQDVEKKTQDDHLEEESKAQDNNDVNPPLTLVKAVEQEVSQVEEIPKETVNVLTEKEDEVTQSSISSDSSSSSEDVKQKLSATESPLHDIVKSALEKYAQEQSFSKIREVLSVILSDPSIVDELQQTLGTQQVKDLVVDIFTAEKNGNDPWVAASSHLISILDIVSKVMQKHPQLFALIPIVAAFILNLIKESPSTKAKKTEENPCIIHNRVFCDGCIQKDPNRKKEYIVGNRYKSAVVEDFDLCEDCEQEGLYRESHGPFLKIYTPSQAPESILCILKDDNRNRSTGFAQFAEDNKQSVPTNANIFIDVDGISAQSLYEQITSTNLAPPSKNLQCPKKHQLNEFSILQLGYHCDVCNAMPRIGEKMFGCRQCDFDICSSCADKFVGPEIRMMKFSCPENHVLAHFLTPHPNYTCDNCLTRSETCSRMFGCRICNFDLCSGCHEESLKRNQAGNKNANKPATTKRPQAKFVEDVAFPDGSIVFPGQVFTKTWKMKNQSATSSWPQGCKIVPVGNVNFNVPASGVIIRSLNPNETAEISIELKAPMQFGRAIGYFRIFTPDNQRFGDRVWIDVNVVDSSQSTGSETIQTSNNDVSFVQESENVTETSSVAVIQPPPTTTASSSLSDIPDISGVTIGQIVLESKEAELMEKYSSEIQSLVDMGFDNIEKNLELLERHSGNMEAVFNDIFNNN